MTKVRPAPTTVGGIAKELGPGLIVAGAVVGSGELIATTLVGAEAGFYLLWLIIVGCVIKVFVQVELGRYAIITGKTTLRGISTLPGWKIGGVHWIVWFWLLMFLTSTAQMGGIVGGIGQALSISAPLTDAGREYNAAADARIQEQLAKVMNTDAPGTTATAAENLPAPIDPIIWAVILSIVTAFILYRGRYGLIEKIVTALVAIFTLVTIVNLILLQTNPVWAVKPSEIWQGLQFRIPPPVEGLNPVATALATFGIIGVAAGELVFYPYWCIEKGYAAFIG
ncbi:MAG: Nramp family divalent metal transporter, partial [Verrucomicrobiota bacterium]